MECRYCPTKGEDKESSEIGLRSFKNGIKSFLSAPEPQKFGQKSICFSGGEPLLRFSKLKGLCGYIQKISGSNSNRCNISVVTNGTLLTKNHILDFKNNNIQLKVSLDGNKSIHDANRHFKLKKYRSTHNRIKQNLGRFETEQYGKKGMRASLVFTPKTVKKLSRSILALKKLGFSHIDFYPDFIADWQEPDLQNLEFSLNAFSDFYISMFNQAACLNDVFTIGLLRSFAVSKNLYKPLTCQKVHLDWRGSFYCCEKAVFLPESERKGYLIGDTKEGIDNKLRLRLLEKKRDEIFRLTGKDCRKCRYVKYCFCPVGFYIFFSSIGKDYKSFFPQFCRVSKIYARNLLKIKKRLSSNPLFSKAYFLEQYN